MKSEFQIFSSLTPDARKQHGSIFNVLLENWNLEFYPQSNYSSVVKVK